jgi:type III pantothenate kinase
MNLLIDIGNTRLKWGLYTEGKIYHTVALAHQSTDFIQQLSAVWQALAAPEKLAIASVSANSITTEVIYLAQRLWTGIPIIRVNSMAKAFGVNNGYLHPKQLGVDRWLSLVASYHQYQQAAWIVDCGTAITLDFIDDQGQHGGGLISPGLQLMKTALLTHTSIVNFSEQDYYLSLANHTNQALVNGTLYAAIGLIHQLINRQPLKAIVILTGGDSSIIAKHLSLPFIIEADLVLKGLAIMLQK